MGSSKPIGYLLALALLLVIDPAAPEAVATPDIEVAAEAVVLHRNEGLVYYPNRLPRAEPVPPLFFANVHPPRHKGTGEVKRRPLSPQINHSSYANGTSLQNTIIQHKGLPDEPTRKN